MIPPEAVHPALGGLTATFAVSVAIVATRRLHGARTLDARSGPHKFHDVPAPRIGGIALFAGLLAGAAVSPPTERALLLTLGIASLPAFAAGLLEDVTNRVPPVLRLIAAFISAWSFCLVSGYAVTRWDASGLDALLAPPVFSIAVTTFLLAGFTHAMNLVDGFHGLAGGTAIVILCALGSLAHLAGDAGLMWTAATLAAVMAGFLLVNFPFGRIFLGDGGACLTGLMTGAVAIMLAARNPEVSVWVVAVVLAYPALETLFSIVRKSIVKGHSPFRADGKHLHMLLYRRLAVRFAHRPKQEWLVNPLTGAFMWGGALTGLVFVAAAPHTRQWAAVFLVLQSMLYLAAYGLLHASLRRHAGSASAPCPSISLLPDNSRDESTTDASR